MDDKPETILEAPILVSGLCLRSCCFVPVEGHGEHRNDITLDLVAWWAPAIHEGVTIQLE